LEFDFSELGALVGGPAFVLAGTAISTDRFQGARATLPKLSGSVCSDSSIQFSKYHSLLTSMVYLLVTTEAGTREILRSAFAYTRTLSAFGMSFILP
jgi:hypothetical protein